MDALMLLIICCLVVVCFRLWDLNRSLEKELNRLQSKLNSENDYTEETNQPGEVDPWLTPLTPPSQNNSETEPTELADQELEKEEDKPILSTEQILDKGINIIERKGVNKSLEWIFENDFKFRNLTSDELTLNVREYEKDVETYSFSFNGMDITVIKGKDKRSSELMPGDAFWTHPVKVLVHDQLVMQTDVMKNYGDYGLSSYDIINSKQSVKCLLLDEWVDQLPELIKHLKHLIRKKDEDERLLEVNKREKQLKGKVDLGKYSED